MKKSLGLFGRYKVKYLVFKLINILISVIALIEPYLISIIITSIMKNRIFEFKRYILLLGLYHIVFTIIRYFLNKLFSKLTIRINNNVKRKIFYSFFGHFQYSNKHNSAKLNNVFTSDFISPLSYLNYLLEYLSEIIVLLFMLAILIKQNILFLYIILLTIPIIFLNIYYSKKIKKYKKIDFYYLDRIFGIIRNMTSNIYKITSNKEIKNPIIDDFNDNINEKILNVDKLNFSIINLQHVMGGIMKINLFLFFILSGILVFNQKINPQIFIFLSFYVQKVFYGIIGLADLIPTVQKYHISLDRVFEVLEINNLFEQEEEKRLGLSNIEKLKIKGGSLRINGAYILKDINLSINKGEHISIEGENGSGKSSLIKLISLQYPLNGGEYLINNKSYKDYRALDIMECISISNQSPVIYPLSLKDNILYDADNINEILNDFDLLEYVESLENGLDTLIDENFELSGGQKKKLELIRCLAKNSSVYILDEPLANVDSDFEKKFDYILKKYFMDKTVIMIEHGSYQSDFFDRYYKIKNGKLEVKNE